MTPRPASHRAPALRGALLFFVAGLLPLQWVVEVESCQGNETTKVLSGVDLLGGLRADPPWAWALPLLLAVTLPFLAPRLRAGPAALAQLVGGLATLAVGWLGWMLLFFALFASRALKGAGWAVAAALALMALDGVARLAGGPSVVVVRHRVDLVVRPVDGGAQA